MAYTYIPASGYSYGGKRNRSVVEFIVIHYTAGKGDAARNEANYFRYGNQRYAGAHFFVDQHGDVIQSVRMNRTAWSVGGAIWTEEARRGGASLYNVATNFNSVSIELCDLVNKAPSDAMIRATRKLVEYIQKKCPNAKTIIRHWDVNGKPCPATMTGANNKAWADFRKAIKGEVSYKVKINRKKIHVRAKPTKKSAHVMYVYKDGIFTIIRKNSTGKWGKLKSGSGWIYLPYTKKVK